jgi:hypothetical protein
MSAALQRRRGPRKPTLLSVTKQAVKAGLDIARVEIDPTGRIVIITGGGVSVDVERNPWDEVLNGDGKDAPESKRTS